MTNTLYDALFAPHHGSAKPFLHLFEGPSITYGAFLDRAERFAAALLDMGIQKGDRLAVQVQKSPDALALYAASIQTGVVLLPLNTAYTAREVAYFVEDSGAAALVADPKAETDLRPIAERLGCRFETLGPDDHGSLAQRASRLPAVGSVTACDADDLGAILYTSGTTGRSKGAMMSHGNLLSNAEALVEAWQFVAEDRLMHALPIFHTHGLFVATNVTARAGGSMQFLPKFDLDRVFEALPRATTMMGVPTFYTRMLEDPRLTRAACAHIRVFISGSAPLLAETHRAFAERTGHAILERYGMTETNMITTNPLSGERRAGTVGAPLPGVDVRVTDASSGISVETGEIGGIEVKGPNVFLGYWNMPEKTAEDMTGDGFFRTGDLGRFGDDGYLEIVGRSKDLIISGGYNIYPKEIELCLDAVPGVLESAIIGVPHSDFGETVVAVVVAEPGVTLTEDVLQAAASKDLAKFKQPRTYVFVDALPRNAMGKVQKVELRARFAELFRPD